jgi:hypothetical protein
MNLICRAELSRRLGVSIEKLYRELGNWMEAPINPFPKPILGRGRGERWNPLAVDRWIENGGSNATLGAGNAPNQETNWAAKLDANAAQIAGR